MRPSPSSPRWTMVLLPSDSRGAIITGHRPERRHALPPRRRTVRSPSVPHGPSGIRQQAIPMRTIDDAWRSTRPFAGNGTMARDLGEDSDMALPNHRLPSQANDPAHNTSSPGPVYCIVGETLCQVCIWTEEEWERLDPVERPERAEHVP